MLGVCPEKGDKEQKSWLGAIIKGDKRAQPRGLGCAYGRLMSLYLKRCNCFISVWPRSVTKKVVDRVNILFMSHRIQSVNSALLSATLDQLPIRSNHNFPSCPPPPQSSMVLNYIDSFILRGNVILSLSFLIQYYLFLLRQQHINAPLISAEMCSDEIGYLPWSNMALKYTISSETIPSEP